MIKGIDVSHHNGTPDFQKAKASGVSFVYVKATEGKTYIDPQFQPNMMNSMAAGLPTGCYHFARPYNKPEDEAANFINTISVFKYDLLPVLDLEYAPNGMSDVTLYSWARSFINAVQEKTGHPVMLYTGLWFLNKYPALQKLNDLPLWIAAYRSQAPTVTGWSNWTMWQYTDCENIPGVGSCDCNYLSSLDDISIERKEAAQTKGNGFTRVLKLTHPPMHGDDVKRLQQRLNIKADGIFGPLTQQAVMNWQRVHDEHGNVVKPGRGLKVDGIVGPKTWGALFR